jgi:enoyl-CoA hydratase/carnithine racemase
MPEVTLPVIPGMEGCHWPFRKARPGDWPRIMKLLLEGRFIKAEDAVGWLVDYAGSLEESLKTVWEIVTDGDHRLGKRELESGPLRGMPTEISGLAPADSQLESARQAIFKTIQDSCAATLEKALDIQARHSAGFMTGPLCKKGAIGSEYKKTVLV